MTKTRSLATRLRSARNLLKKDRDTFDRSERWADGTMHIDGQRILKKYDDALQALAEAIKREAGR